MLAHNELQQYLVSTAIIDSDHQQVAAYAREHTRNSGDDPISKAVALYYAVRDKIWYTPYYPFYLPEHYRASNVLQSGKGYCVSKASLLCALGRACGIPSRFGFADVKNHLATRQLLDYMGSDLFVYHGFVEFYLDNKWVKATPAFNASLCRRHQVVPLEFNGHEDSVFQAYNEDQQRFMEYINDHGVFDDIPVDAIVTAWRKTYTDARVDKWIRQFDKNNGRPIRNFAKEDVVHS